MDFLLSDGKQLDLARLSVVGWAENAICSYTSLSAEGGDILIFFWNAKCSWRSECWRESWSVERLSPLFLISMLQSLLYGSMGIATCTLPGIILTLQDTEEKCKNCMHIWQRKFVLQSNHKRDLKSFSLCDWILKEQTDTWSSLQREGKRREGNVPSEQGSSQVHHIPHPGCSNVPVFTHGYCRKTQKYLLWKQYGWRGIKWRICFSQSWCLIHC